MILGPQYCAACIIGVFLLSSILLTSAPAAIRVAHRLDQPVGLRALGVTGLGDGEVERRLHGVGGAGVGRDPGVEQRLDRLGVGALRGVAQRVGRDLDASFVEVGDARRLLLWIGGSGWSPPASSTGIDLM